MCIIMYDMNIIQDTLFTIPPVNSLQWFVKSVHCSTALATSFHCSGSAYKWR